MINDPRLFLALSPRLLSLYLATTIHPNFYIPNGYILVLRRSEELNDRIWYEFNLASRKSEQKSLARNLSITENYRKNVYTYLRSYL